MTLEEVTAVGVLATTIITTYIAYQQYRQGQRANLYEKRYQIFVAVMEFLGHILAHANTDDHQLRQLIQRTREANFLFGDDVPMFIKSIHDRGVDLMCSKMELDPMPVGPERTAAVQKNTEHLKWLTSQFEESVKIFGRYLKLQ